MNADKLLLEIFIASVSTLIQKIYSDAFFLVKRFYPTSKEVVGPRDRPDKWHLPYKMRILLPGSYKSW